MPATSHFAGLPQHVARHLEALGPAKSTSAAGEVDTRLQRWEGLLKKRLRKLGENKTLRGKKGARGIRKDFFEASKCFEENTNMKTPGACTFLDHTRYFEGSGK